MSKAVAAKCTMWIHRWIHMAMRCSVRWISANGWTDMNGHERTWTDYVDHYFFRGFHQPALSDENMHQRVDPGLASCLGGPSFCCPWAHGFGKLLYTAVLSTIFFNQEWPLTTDDMHDCWHKLQVVIVCPLLSKMLLDENESRGVVCFHSFLHVFSIACLFPTWSRSKWVAGQDARKSLDCTIRYYAL